VFKNWSLTIGWKHCQGPLHFAALVSRLTSLNDSPTPPRYAIIGGGISSLTAAYRLHQLQPHAHIDVFEASDRLGGVLFSHREGDFLIERGADSFITKQPWALELCQELGIAEELIPTNTEHRRALVLHEGELFPVPEGFVLIRPQLELSIKQTPLLSDEGKEQILAERDVPLPANINDAAFDDNLAHFASSRLGREAFERLVEPLVAGIFTADADKLSVAATMPEAVDVLRRHGTLWHRDQTQETASGARYGSFVTPRGGVGRLVEALAERLPAESIHLNQPIHGIEQNTDGTWILQAADDKKLGAFAGVIVALPTPQAARLLESTDADLAGLLRRVEYASSAVVTFAFKNEHIGRALDGFGFVVPRVEKSNIVAASFSTVKFPGRAPDDTVLVRVFLGGAQRPEMVELPDAELVRIAGEELRKILKITGTAMTTDVAKWHEKMPQYHVGHVQLVDAIEERVNRIPGIALAGNGYRGVGIPWCVRSGDLAARKMVEEI
jgi:oxygen-dependent protoporphyrinogen oxidase